MSRVSINRRLERLRDFLLPPGSLEWRIDRLPDHLKRAHSLWREKGEAINLASKKRGENLYANLLDGCDDAPMPSALQRALFPDGMGGIKITTEMTAHDAASAWTAMLEQGRPR